MQFSIYLRWVRTGYAYQPPALGTYRRRREACPQGPTFCTYWVHEYQLGRAVRTAHGVGVMTSVP